MTNNHHQNPNNHKQSNENLLRESQEISLGIKPKVNLHKPKHSHSTNGHNSLVSSMGVAKVLPLSDEIKAHSSRSHSNHGNGNHEHTKPHHNHAHAHRKLKINLAPIDFVPKKEFEPDKKTKRILKRINKARKHRYWGDAKLIVGTVLFFFLIFNSQLFISRILYTFSGPNNQESQQNNQQDQSVQEAQAVSAQNEIIIPKIGVRAPIIFAKSNKEEDVMVDLRDGVVHYYGTANPGELGNSVIFGHSSNDWWEQGNYKFVFVLLEKLSIGDKYEINFNSKKYVYEVTNTKVVEATDLSVLDQTDEFTSTLITCTPPGTDWRRFIVSSRQVSPEPNINAETANQPPQPELAESKLPSDNLGFWNQLSSFFGGLFGGEDRNAQDSNQSKPRLPEIN